MGTPHSITFARSDRGTAGSTQINGLGAAVIVAVAGVKPVVAGLGVDVGGTNNGRSGEAGAALVGASGGTPHNGVGWQAARRKIIPIIEKRRSMFKIYKSFYVMSF
jgi:hypothetical protein